MTCLAQENVSRAPAWISLTENISTGSAAAGRVNRAVAVMFGVRIADLCGPARGSARIVLARQVAMYLAHVEFGLSLAEVGEAFGRNRTTAARACRRIEDLRTDGRLEARLARLERGLRAKSAAPCGVAQ